MDHPTLAAAFREHAMYLVHALGRLGVREADREDLAQEVFLIAHRKWSDYEPQNPVKPWLFGIAFRVALAYRRRAATRLEVLGERLERVPVPARIEDELERARLTGIVAAALETVGAPRREVLVLHHVHGFSMPEIAAALEIPLNTGYSRLRVGRAELRAAILGRVKNEEG